MVWGGEAVLFSAFWCCSLQRLVTPLHLSPGSYSVSPTKEKALKDVVKPVEDFFSPPLVVAFILQNDLCGRN